MTELSNTDKPSTVSSKKPYSQPQLIRHGDLRGMTLGGSPTDIGDSGDQFTKKLAGT